MSPAVAATVWTFVAVVGLVGLVSWLIGLSGEWGEKAQGFCILVLVLAAVVIIWLGFYWHAGGR